MLNKLNTSHSTIQHSSLVHNSERSVLPRQAALYAVIRLWTGVESTEMERGRHVNLVYTLPSCFSCLFHRKHALEM